MLDPVNLTVKGGECICITGPSGAGKTLLLRALADLDPHDGKVFLDDVDSQHYSGHVWRRQVAYLPAESRWWYDTVDAHLPAGAAHLHDLGFSPDILQRDIMHLSSGEKQRLAAIRILSNKPRVLLLDEPTATLDHANALRLEAVIERYQSEHQASVIWVSHDTAQISRVADRHFKLHDGQLEGPI